MFANAVSEVEALGARRAQDLHEAEALISYLAPFKPKVYLEIGARHGWTFYLVGKLLKPDLMIAVDLPGLHPWGDDGSEKILERVREAVGGIVVFGDSRKELTIGTVDAWLDGRQVDVLFIDGDHKYNGVRQDWLNYKPFVKSGGHVVFHDINAPQSKKKSKEKIIEVDKFWNELAPLFDYSHAIDAGTGMGIGIIRV